MPGMEETTKGTEAGGEYFDGLVKYDTKKRPRRTSKTLLRSKDKKKKKEKKKIK